jgi:hypothetical protein
MAGMYRYNSFDHEAIALPATQSAFVHSGHPARIADSPTAPTDLASQFEHNPPRGCTRFAGCAVRKTAETHLPASRREFRYVGGP